MAYLQPAQGRLRARSRGTELDTFANTVPMTAVADVATADADGTYGSAEADLINELKTKLNTTLARLRTAGILASS